MGVGTPGAGQRADVARADVARDATALLVLVTRLARVHDAAMARIAAPHGLLPSETAVLLTLWWSGPPHRMRPSALAEALVQTSGGMTSTLRRLGEAGFVERVADPADGRVSLAALTDAGREAGLASLGDMTAWMVGVLERTSPDERADVVAALRTLVGAVERAEGRPSSAGIELPI